MNPNERPMPGLGEHEEPKPEIDRRTPAPSEVGIPADKEKRDQWIEDQPAPGTDSEEKSGPTLH